MVTSGLQEGGGEAAEGALQGERVDADCDAQMNEEAPVRHNKQRSERRELLLP
jgi:hypothetical protein